MIHVRHPQTPDGEAVIARDSNRVALVIVRNLVEVSTRARRLPRPHRREVVHSDERMRRGRVHIGQVVRKRGLGRDKAVYGSDELSPRTGSKKSHCVSVSEVVVCLIVKHATREGGMGVQLL